MQSQPTTAQSAASNLTGPSETLLITLMARAIGSNKKSLPGFSDKAAESVCQQLNLDPSRYAGSPSTLRGVLLRSQWFDAQVTQFLTANPNGQILSLGAGLSTMYERTAARQLPGNWSWLDTDLSDVIALRQTVLPNDQRRTSATLDLRDPEWIELPELQHDSPLLIVVEGVLMYLHDAKVEQLFQCLANLASRRRRVHIAFDWCSPFMVRHGKKHPAIKRIKDRTVGFVSAMKRPDDISNYDPHWRVLKRCNEVTKGSGVASALFGIVHKLLTGGRQVYGCALAVYCDIQSNASQDQRHDR